MGAEPATIAGRRAAIRGELRQRMQTQREQREKQQQLQEQVGSLWKPLALRNKQREWKS